MDNYKACENCGGRIYEYGCVNCNEQDYIDMQDKQKNLQKGGLEVTYLLSQKNK